MVFAELRSVARQKDVGDGDDVGQPVLEWPDVHPSSPRLGDLHTGAAWDEVIRNICRDE